ncbi:hypothetical protein ABB37_05862 [Leptomonas pyrrhocoris]|uniref:PIN domain-containing protein n=1 Tax=Leptomonas pyrrhocoris TaxID=157538 RepID=A0A0N0DUC9_LEPPY|nr:hypothetical protein ABB37_05862 [Leptomonas pyrrhocoris]XP_015657181.1 hypothetical protein ABB37_05862 [Leptomonas pyrrhocoris]KPA78741.1 hypothetical protein ABB37_05862 [Leptomonas pyrrhocoris]KPA78742.1 hypothetical protein ABB37_05862 [Leptomonas pyrrhocoris]|eukprot:XP_015657180.1 hypothetical protein ABB37_05862 [Leptomonas pyrrhocoris]
MQKPHLANNIPCCIVMDTSALLDTQFDMVELLSCLLPNSPHVVVIPEDVWIELKGVANSTDGATASRAESVTKALAKYPDFRSHATQTPARKTNAAGASSSSSSFATANAAAGSRGVAVLQKSKETFYPLKKFARNRDTKIVACAYYFTVHDSNTLGVGDTRSCPLRRFRYENAFFVTNDVVQQIKASPYKIPTIDSSDLKRHWGHLGHWES